MRWSNFQDEMMLREVLVHNPFQAKNGVKKEVYIFALSKLRIVKNKSALTPAHRNQPKFKEILE